MNYLHMSPFEKITPPTFFYFYFYFDFEAQLKDALRVAKETEEMGRETMQMLEIQREQMIGMTGKVIVIKNFEYNTQN
jgi:hypothetical protein